jgi:branched-chain amino acid transport system permease protein
MNKLKQAVSSIGLTGVVAIVLTLALIVVPLAVDIGNYILTVMISLLIYVTLSESWNLMGGYAGQVNLGFGAYFGTGALCYILSYVAGVPLPVAFVAGGLAAIVIACIIGPPTLRLRGAYFGIGTMALAEVLRLVSTTTFTQSIYSPPSYWTTFTLIKSYYIALVVALATILVAYIVVHSKLGLILQAIRDDEDAANASGINPAKYKMIVFIISSFLAGVAGGVLSYHRGSINVPGQFSMEWTIGAMVSVTIGGWGTLTGPVLGSMIFVLLREMLGRTLPTAYLVVTGIIFVLVIVFLPDGLVSIGTMIRNVKSMSKGGETDSKNSQIRSP